MNTKKNQLAFKSAQGELWHQESLDNTSMSSSVKDSKLSQEKLSYVAPAIMLFSAFNTILNSPGSGGDNISADAQS